jgi:hypothetical protein
VGDRWVSVVKEAARVVAENIPGVRRVVNNIGDPVGHLFAELIERLHRRRHGPPLRDSRAE